ncbi:MULTISPECIES: hypothetical protein [Niallia]|uniref:Uncharacterized protein n=1 Tax=Niallia hominis TaxID=3133173 RepID=A0ABV1F4V5_9BACI|nr:hypothetical protein [Niallia sp. MER TA 168]MCM3363921.1 hypothetical protein [Niallia sp. MER TA 168]
MQIKVEVASKRAKVASKRAKIANKNTKVAKIPPLNIATIRPKSPKLV